MMRISVAAVVVGLAACTPPLDRAAEETALMNADRAFAAATAQRGLEGWVDAFAQDGFMLRPDAPVVPGRDEVRATMEAPFADPTFSLRWEPHSASVSAAGDLGFTIGTYESVRRDSLGQAVVRTGKYLTVWRRQPDGAWKVAADVGVPDTPPPEPPPATPPDSL